ncbi:hypothetical protein PM082_023116 [Marasmius tenuissimus]|nr:hypothetical protein PM082_023116 [Marasmius tenuissimus]
MFSRLVPASMNNSPKQSICSFLSPLKPFYRPPHATVVLFARLRVMHHSSCIIHYRHLLSEIYPHRLSQRSMFHNPVCAHDLCPLPSAAFPPAPTPPRLLFFMIDDQPRASYYPNIHANPTL